MIIEHFRELWRYRVLIEALVRRDVKARYRGSVFGFLWTLLNPLLLLIVYRFVFTRATKAVDMHNYAAFLLAGLLPWQWLAQSVINGATSIFGNSSLITRACMPPQILPAVCVLANLVNFLLAFPVAIGAALWYGIAPSPALLLLPVVIAIQAAFVYGLALAAGTIAVRFRDIQFLVQNLLMVWFFLTPLAYPVRDLPESYRFLVTLNPAAPVLLPYQEIVHGRSAPPLEWIGLALLFATLSVAAGVSIFERARDSIAEDL